MTEQGPDEQDLIRKIGLLLAKAEGTDNPHEADAFYAKAHDMMMRYAIEEQRVRMESVARDGRRLEEPVLENFMFSSYAHHRQAKQHLLEVVCESQHVRYIHYDNSKGSNASWSSEVREANRGLKESQWTRLIGYKNDIEHVKLLYLSLLLQSQKFANEDWRVRYGDAKYTNDYERIGKFTWLSSHMNGFAERIQQRFRDLTRAIYDEIKDSDALILDKDTNILEWMYEHGILHRPVVQTEKYCWTLQPESDPGWPRTVKGEPSKKHRALYCIIRYPIGADGHEGPHVYNYDTGPTRYSYYVSKGGRQTSYEGKQAGRVAAGRADIGLSRTGAGQSSQLKG